MSPRGREKSQRASDPPRLGELDFDAEFDLVEQLARASGRPLSMTWLQRDPGGEQWQAIRARVESAVAAGLPLHLQTAARAIGVTDLRIMWRHILPNLLAPVMVIWTLELARVILMESALSFLGVGVPPPTPTWGRMLAEGRGLLTTAPWIATFPGVAITIMVLGVNFLGDGLRDLLDPRLRKQT